MPPKSIPYWTERAGRPGTTWYRSRPIDTYTDLMWKTAFRRLGVAVAGRRVLDVGCGDGKYSHWLRDRGAEQVLGVDWHDYGARPQPGVSFQNGVDIESLWSLYRPGQWELALVSGVIELTSDWRRALLSILCVAREVVVLEEMRERHAPYQLGLAHKTPISWADFQAEVAQIGSHRIAKWVPMNVLDRCLIVRTPRALLWPSALVTLAADQVAVRIPALEPWTRFRAIHLVSAGGLT